MTTIKKFLALINFIDTRFAFAMELYFMGLGVGATLTGIVESCGISSTVLAYMLPALTVLVTLVLGLSRGMVQKMFPEQAPEVKAISRTSRRATISSKRRK